jgi:hypothetical protein
MNTPRSENRRTAARLSAAHEIAKALCIDPAQPGSARLADALARPAEAGQPFATQGCPSADVYPLGRPATTQAREQASLLASRSHAM